MAAKQEIKNNVLMLGIVSFLTDISSEMIFPLVPIFMNVFLGAGKEIIGLMEGIADSISSLLDIVFGYWSDRSKSRKKFVLLGYGFSSFLKIGIALSTIWQQMFVFRGLERIGKSIRTSPRDAIIADSSDEKTRGKAFGLHRAMDTVGAIIGPAAAYIILSYFGNTENAYRAVFQAAVLPAFLALVVIIFLVHEPKPRDAKPREGKPKFWNALKMLGNDYRRFISISVLFSLSYFSFALLIIRANEIGIKPENILLMYLLFNVVYALSSIPIGSASDKIGRKNVIAAAFALYAFICIGFAFASELWQVAALFFLYGLFVAADESVNKAYVSELVESRARGIAFGAYNSAVSAAYLPASALLGIAWASFGAVAAFGGAAAIAAASSILFFKFSK